MQPPSTAWTVPTLKFEMAYLESGSQTIGNSVDWGHVLQPIKLTRGRGPQGGELTCRAIRRWAWTGAGYYDSYVGGDPVDLLTRGLLCLFISYPGTARRMVFRGQLQSIEKQFSASENGVTLVFSDWMPANLFYVSGIQYSLVAGKTIEAINQADVWLKNSSGAKLYQAGASAISMPGLTPDTFTYQPVGTSISKCIDSNRRYLADIEHPITKDGTSYIVARKRGTTTATLWHGKVGSVTYASQYQPSITEMRGGSDYSRIIHTITGIGGTKIQAKSVALVPAWDASLNSTALSNPAALTLPEYAEVGRKFTLPMNAYGIDSTTSNGINEMTYKLWGARGSGEWSELPIHSSLVNSSASQNPNAGYRTFSCGAAKQFILLDAPAIYEYYSAGRRRYEFYSLQLQANYNDGLLTMSTTASTPSPLASRRIWQNDAYTSMTVSGTYARPHGSRTGRAMTDGKGTYDNSMEMASALLDVLKTTEGPMQSFSCKLVYCDFGWTLGTGIAAIRDAAGVHTETPKGWFVEGITHNLRTEDNSAYTTELTISREESEYLGGLVL